MREVASTWMGLTGRHRLALLVTATAATVLVALSIAGARVRPTNAVLVFMLLTLLVSATYGLKVGLISALVSDVALVFFFFEPIFVFWARDVQLQISLGIFILVSVIAGSLLQQKGRGLTPVAALAGGVGGNLGPAKALDDSQAPSASQPLYIDFEARLVLVNGTEVMLTPTEFTLLGVLAMNAGRVMTHRAIIASVWGEEYGEDSQILRTYVKQLRSKLGDDPAMPRFIRTEPRVGYRFLNPTSPQ